MTLRVVNADTERARALVWRDLEGRATAEETAWLNHADHLGWYRAALAEVAQQLAGQRGPQHRIWLTACSRLSDVNARIKAANRIANGQVKPPVSPVPAPRPQAAQPDLDRALTEVIDLLHGVGELKAHAVRDRVGRQKLIELRLVVRGQR